MTGTDRKTHREITGNYRFTSRSVTTYYQPKNLPFWWRNQPDGICSNRKTTGISVSIYYIRKLSPILKTQRGRSRKSQRGQIVLKKKKKKKKRPKEADHVNPKEVRSCLKDPLRQNISASKATDRPGCQIIQNKVKVFAVSITGKFKPGGRKALTKDFPAKQGKATNHPDRQDTQGQVFHVFSHKIQTVSRCIISLLIAPHHSYKHMFYSSFTSVV